MKIDTFLTIGRSHKVCEDYILSGDLPMPYMIISDGCSSSKGTDMGARLLCYLAKQYLKFRAETSVFEKFEPDHNEMGLWIIHNAELVAKQLGLPANSLDATLIVAYQNMPNNIRVHFYGDGCIVTFTDHTMSIGQVDYSKNAPYYLSYLIDPPRHRLFHEMKQDKVIKTWHQKTAWESTEDKYAYDTPTVCNYDISGLKGLILASDGLVSFIEDRVGPIHVIDYIPDFVAFKTTAGEFMKRRANAVLRQLEKDKITNADDLSIGAFLTED
jgi:hypothetical protein